MNHVPYDNDSGSRYQYGQLNHLFSGGVAAATRRNPLQFGTERVQGWYMARFIKRGGSWTAQVRRKGVQASRTFPTKSAAQIWAQGIEADILSGTRGVAPNKDFGALLAKFRDEECPKREGCEWEAKRIKAMLRDDLAKIRLPDLDSTHIAAWRDRRLQSVKGSTVNRDWNLLSSICTVAEKEWRWLSKNPFSDVRRPPQGEKRDRLYTALEIEALEVAAGQPDSIAWRTFQCFRWALETGMRQGEIAALEPRDIVGRVAKVRGEEMRAGKTYAARREVPLTETALAIAGEMRGRMFNEKLFGLTASQIESHFRLLRGKAGGSGYKFHDSRHNAATEWAKRLKDEGPHGVLTLCRIFGWTDVKMALTYFNESAADIANKL